MPKISPFLWFDDQAEQAANLYVSLFRGARIVRVTRNVEGGAGPAGGVLVVEFELFGQAFKALNGGPEFRFTEAVSFMVDCEDQAEVDRYWNGLIADGGAPSQGGWLKDRFGLSWQIVPKQLMALLSRPDPATAGRVMAALMTMGKVDVAKIEAAAAG